jgi:hypothetical protein
MHFGAKHKQQILVRWHQDLLFICIPAKCR